MCRYNKPNDFRKYFTIIIVLFLSTTIFPLSLNRTAFYSDIVFNNEKESKKSTYFSKYDSTNIVKGTAIAFDSKAYFIENEIQTCKVNIRINTNIPDLLEISIGFKTPLFDLMDTPDFDKSILENCKEKKNMDL